MRLVRIETEAGPSWGAVDMDQVALLKGSFAKGFEHTGERVARPSTLLSPVEPTKIICTARNYPKHAEEMGGEVPTEPRIFLKAPSAIVPPGSPIVLPPGAGRVDPEGELGVVIKHQARNLTAEDALEAVFGYTIVNDVTAREYQKADRIYGRAKSFDSFCPVGPWVDTVFKPGDWAIETAVNGEIRAQGSLTDMTFSVTELLIWISSIMTLEPGDLIATGTPPGVAPLEAGDQVEVTIDRLGTLRNPVVQG